MDKRVLSLTFLLIAVSIPGLARSADKTLTRVEDFVVVTGKDVPALIGARVSDLRLYACEAGKCQAAPLQVDKVDENGRYVFPTDANADRDGSALDPNDEISFMAEDAGDSAPKGFAPQTDAKGMSIELIDPLDDGRAWVYLFNAPGSMPPATADYIDYVLEDGTALLKSPQYELGWGEGMINADNMRLATAGGELSPDLLDRQMVGLQARLIGEYNMPINAPESIVKAQDIAVIDGPVRVIIDQVIVINVVNISLQWGTEYFVKYYRCGQNNSVNFDFPTAANILKTISFYWSLDFNELIVGSYYVDPKHDQPIPIEAGAKVDGVPDDDFHYWYGVYGKNGAVVQALKLDDEVLEYFGCKGKWRQDADALDRKGDHRGRLEIGFTCTEIDEMPEKIEYHWFNYILFPKEPTLEGVKQLRNLVEHPLTTTVSELL